MENLLTPDVGLVFWTVVTFLALVWALKRLAWAPLLSAINEREGRIRADREAAEKARVEAEKVKADLDSRLADLSSKSREIIDQAAREAETFRAKLKSEAEAEARRLKERTHAELSAEKERLIGELRKEVSSLSVSVAEKLMRRSVDEQVRKSVLESFFKELEERKSAR